MKLGRNRFQLAVLKRVESGLPPSRWQQFRLHTKTAWWQRRELNVRKAWFYAKVVLRIFSKPFTLFRVGSVPVQVHTTCTIYPLGLLTRFNWDEHGGRVLILVLIFLSLLCGSLLVHEFAHVFVARRFGIGTRRVVFIPFGVVAELESMPRAPHEIWIALAGPLASFTLAGMFWLADHSIGTPGASWPNHLGVVLMMGFAINMILALFNLLPCFPMDGGRILRSLLAVIIRLKFPQHAGNAFVIATRIAVRYVACFVALGMIALTIMVTHLWLHLILFPLLLLAAEIEYWLLRTDDGRSENSG